MESRLAQELSGRVLDPPAADLQDTTLTRIAVGARLGPYQIEGFLGAGGMGKVYRAVDTRLGRRVAIKASAQRFGDRFEREARVIASLNHPHICTLYDVGPNYLVMEHLEGETLAQTIAKGPLPLIQALGIAIQIADALDAAHCAGCGASGFEAVQHYADEIGREASRFRFGAHREAILRG